MARKITGHPFDLPRREEYLSCQRDFLKRGNLDLLEAEGFLDFSLAELLTTKSTLCRDEVRGEYDTTWKMIFLTNARISDVERSQLGPGAVLIMLSEVPTNHPPSIDLRVDQSPV